jgi:hypothetical protein
MWSAERHGVELADVEMIPSKPNAESGVASVNQWNARSTLGSVAEFSNVVCFPLDVSSTMCTPSSMSGE